MLLLFRLAEIFCEACLVSSSTLFICFKDPAKCFSTIIKVFVLIFFRIVLSRYLFLTVLSRGNHSDLVLFNIFDWVILEFAYDFIKWSVEAFLFFWSRKKCGNLNNFCSRCEIDLFTRLNWNSLSAWSCSGFMLSFSLLFEEMTKIIECINHSYNKIWNQLIMEWENILVTKTIKLNGEAQTLNLNKRGHINKSHFLQHFYLKRSQQFNQVKSFDLFKTQKCFPMQLLVTEIVASALNSMGNECFTTTTCRSIKQILSQYPLQITEIE